MRKITSIIAIFSDVDRPQDLKGNPEGLLLLLATEDTLILRNFNNQCPKVSYTLLYRTEPRAGTSKEGQLEYESVKTPLNLPTVQQVESIGTVLKILHV